MVTPMRYCIPGERLCNLEEGSPGSGTYTRHGYIFSSLAGYVMKSSKNSALPVVSVMREAESQLLPDVGTIVTCKVSCFAKVHILYVGSTPLKNSFQGTLRKEAALASEKDKVEVYKIDVRCSVLRPTLKNSGKWPEYSLNFCRPKMVHFTPRRG
uniref:Exosome complex component N-terminal domain-containing protein n=1 Tax=Spermophilus dauricus TaxID=99837 RepID=A0A8C9P730_SPEDA